MTRARCALAGAAALLGLAACGTDEVDLTGVYRVDADLASMPCGTDQAVMTPPVALKFAKANFFGAEYFSYAECTNLAGTMCSPGGLLDAAFSEPIDSGWRGIVTMTASVSSTMCALSYTEQTAVLHGAVLVIEIHNYSELVDNTATLCTTDEADRRNTSMPCGEHERIEATKQ